MGGKLGMGGCWGVGEGQGLREGRGWEPRPADPRPVVCTLVGGSIGVGRVDAAAAAFLLFVQALSCTAAWTACVVCAPHFGGRQAFFCFVGTRCPTCCPHPCDTVQTAHVCHVM